MRPPRVENNRRSLTFQHEFLNFFLKLEDSYQATAVKQIQKAKLAISRILATQHPVKILAILALGAILLAGIAHHFSQDFTIEISSSGFQNF